MEILKKAAALAAALALCAALAGCMKEDAASSAQTSEAAGREPAATAPANGETPGEADGGASGSGAADGSGEAAPVGPTASPTASAAPDAAAAPGAEAAGSGASSATRNSGSKALGALLDNCVSYETGTAGGSLKTAKAAADLVALLARDAPADLRGEADAWRQGLDAGREETLQANWPAISLQARAIADDPAGCADLLATAGVTTDFTAMDLGGIGSCMDTLDDAFAPRK